MKIKLLVLLLLCSFFNFGQESRTLLKGRLLYRNSNVIAANVINISASNVCLKNKFIINFDGLINIYKYMINKNT